MTLEELVRSLISAEYTVERIQSEDAAWGNLGVFLTDILNDIVPGDNHLIPRLFRRMIEPYKHLNQVVLGPYRKYFDLVSMPSEKDNANVVVLASGNLGLIYSTDWRERLSYKMIEEAYPNLIPGLAQHEGIGFIMVRSENSGPLIIGENGTLYLKEGRVIGENPLTNFGNNAAEHLRRTNSFPHVPDILVNSLYDPKTGEVAAFEELVGSHGGLGGSQASPFIMFPKEWEILNANIVGAGELHKQLKFWLHEYSPI